MKRKIMVKIIAFVILITLTASHILGTPLTGAQGSRVQAYFMSQDPDPADAGKYLDLRWQIVNTLSTPEDLSFSGDVTSAPTTKSALLGSMYIGKSFLVHPCPVSQPSVTLYVPLMALSATLSL